MVRHPLVIANLVVLLSACGGGDKPAPKKPEVVEEAPPPPKAETEEDRAQKRLAAAHAIVPEGSACLPAALKGESAPRLELAGVGSAAIVCAIDTDETRLLGPVGCWTVDLASGALTYKEPAPLPGHSLPVNLDDRCARGYCLPKDAKADTKLVHLTWNADSSKVAVLAGDDVHVFDAASKAHEKSFSVRGDKGVSNDPSAIHWVSDSLFVEGRDQGPYAAVWAFKADGTQVGPIVAIGAKGDKPVSTYNGSFSVLDATRVAVSEQGFSTLTIFDAADGKRSKLVRKLAKPPCKQPELDAYWTDSADGVGAKCKEHMTKNFGTLIGATAVAGSKNFLVMLRGARLGELAVLDAKSLAEKKAIKLPWCEAGGSDDAAAAESAAPAAKAKASSKRAEDPDAGGE